MADVVLEFALLSCMSRMQKSLRTTEVSAHLPCNFPSFLDRLDTDTLSQGYTNLQSLVKCLDHRGIASDTVCSQARLCWAAQCIDMHLGGYIYSHGE